MTLSQFQVKLQQANPKLRIKRYGSSKAGIHYGNQFICRVPQGEITYYNVTEERIGHSSEMITEGNPSGKYAYQYLLRRGRYDTARRLASEQLISWADVPRVASI